MTYFSKINPIYFPVDQSPFDITEDEAANEFEPSFNQMFFDTDVIILQAAIPEHASGSAFSVKVDGVTYSAPYSPMKNLNGLDYHTVAVPLSPHLGKILYIQANITDNNATPTAQTFTSWPVEVISASDDCAKFYRKIVYSGNSLAYSHWFDGSLIRPMIRANARIRFAEADDIYRNSIRTPDNDTLLANAQTATVSDVFFEFQPLWMIEKMTYIMRLPDVEINGNAVLQQSPLRTSGQRRDHENALFQSDMQVVERFTPNILTPY